MQFSMFYKCLAVRCPNLLCEQGICTICHEFFQALPSDTALSRGTPWPAQPGQWR